MNPKDENVELARRLYAALSRGDIEAFIDQIDPEVEFRSLIAEAEGKVYRGHQGMREWWADVGQSLGVLEYEPEEFRAVGEDGLMIRVRVKGEVRDLPIEQTMWQVARVGEQGPFWWQTFRSEDEALAELERRQGEGR